MLNLKQIRALTIGLTISAITSIPSAQAFGLGDVVQAVSDTAQDVHETTTNTVEHGRDTAEQVYNDVTQSTQNQTTQPGPNLPNGGTVQVDVPNPIRAGAGIVGEAGRTAGQIGNRIGNGARDAYNHLENAPGMSVGAEADVSIRGHRYNFGGKAEVDNPLRGMRENAENMHHWGMGRAGEVRGHFKDARDEGIRRMQDAYTDLENQPGVSIGGRGEVDVNGNKYGHGGRLEVNNPLRDIRRGFEDAHHTVEEEARNGRRVARDRWNDLYNAPGVSTRAGGTWRSDGNSASGTGDVSVNPYHGDDLKVRVSRRDDSGAGRAFDDYARRAGADRSNNFGQVYTATGSNMRRPQVERPMGQPVTFGQYPARQSVFPARPNMERVVTVGAQLAGVGARQAIKSFFGGGLPPFGR